MIDYDKFRMSLKRLEEQHENNRTLDTSLPGLIQEAVAESVIQRFETCYDCLWKVLKRYLIYELGISDAPNSPKPIFRLANENDLFIAESIGVNGCATLMPVSIPPTITMVRRRRLVWRSCQISSTTLSAFAKL